MMKTIHKFAFALAAVFMATNPGVAQADSELFFAGAFSYAQFDDDFRLQEADELEALFDDKSLGFNGAVGWRFNNWLAVDFGYWDFGEFKSDRLGNGDKIEIDSTSFTIGGLASVPLWILDVYARGGVAFWDADSSQLDDDGTDPYYGVGAALNIGRNVDLYLEWVRFELLTDLDTASFGVRITF